MTSLVSVFELCGRENEKNSFYKKIILFSTTRVGMRGIIFRHPHHSLVTQTFLFRTRCVAMQSVPAISKTHATMWWSSSEPTVLPISHRGIGANRSNWNLGLASPSTHPFSQWCQPKVEGPLVLVVHRNRKHVQLG